MHPTFTKKAFSRAEQIANDFINQQQPIKMQIRNNKISNRPNYSTIKDSLTEYNNSLQSTDLNINTHSDKIISKPHQPHKKTNSILIQKELIKYAEPRFKLSPSIKIPQKFNINTNTFKYSINTHALTLSESDFFEIDEKVPQVKFEQIAAKKNVFMRDYFAYRILVEMAKIYEQVNNELKDNGLENLENKENLAFQYIKLFFDEENTIGNSFQYNKKVNKFLIKELCVFLILLFISEYGNLGGNELIHIKTCFSYCHLNFLFVVMVVVNNSNNIQDTVNFEKCKTLIELNSNRIEQKKYKKNFQSQNKIIKTVLLDLLSNLSEINKEKTKIIFDIFDSLKKKKFYEIREELMKNPILIDKKKEISSKQKDIDSAGDNQELQWIENEELPQPDPPFIPPKAESDKREYTLVLDLDETLVRFCQDENDESAYIKVRPYTEEFIMTLWKYCEIVIFTAGLQNYADTVIDGIIKSNVEVKVDFRLYRQHTTVINGFNVKDLSKIGRDLSKILIIDNIEENYSLQPENGLNIIDFEGDEDDNELLFLLDDLQDIVKLKNVDVREHLPAIRRKMRTRKNCIY